jgi:hypothetical protein
MPREQTPERVRLRVLRRARATRWARWREDAGKQLWFAFAHPRRWAIDWAIDWGTFENVARHLCGQTVTYTVTPTAAATVQQIEPGRTWLTNGSTITWTVE